jgi:large subunit ribosomal protein L9
MQIILIKNVPKLGKPGEIKDVADGFAQNFLLPGRLALPATPKNIAAFKNRGSSVVETKKSLSLPLEELAGQLAKVNLSFTEKADETGTLFAGISAEKIEDALAKLGYQIAADKIKLAHPIKKVGAAAVEIFLAPRKSVRIKISVQAS